METEEESLTVIPTPDCACRNISFSGWDTVSEQKASEQRAKDGAGGEGCCVSFAAASTNAELW